MRTFSKGITRTFSSGWYAGLSLLATIPWKWDVGLAGYPYLIDMDKIQDFRHRSTPLLRTQGDASQEPGAASVNPESLWTRSRTSWHRGAGQVHADDDFQQADPLRFRTSKGIDVWTEGRISLLHAVDQKVSTSSTNLRLCPTGPTATPRLYLLDGTAVKFLTAITDDTPSLTTVTSSGANTKLSICSDGYTVWFTDGTDVYSTNTGATAASVYNTLDCTILAYVNGRLMAAQGAAIYNITSGTPPTALFTQANTDFVWVGFAEGAAGIYAAGFSGDKSLIYRIGLRPDATALDQPVVAGTLPDGEIIRSIYGYLGFIVLGTDKGWRFAVPDAQGNLRIGANVATPSAVRCFEGQDRFIWFGYTNYDSASTGLGRMDVTVWGDQDRQQPAYATDLMCTTQGNVLDVCTFNATTVFAVSGSGIWAQDTPLVASGTLQNGHVDFGLADEKIALELAITYGANLAGSAAVGLAVDESSTFATIGTTSTAGETSAVFPAGERRAHSYEVQVTLTRDASVTSTGPTVTLWTLKAQPAPEVKPMIFVPLLIWDQMETKDLGTVYAPLPPVEQVDSLKTLNTTREVVAYQESGRSYQVIVEGYEWQPEEKCKKADHGWQGTALIQLKVLS